MEILRANIAPICGARGLRSNKKAASPRTVIPGEAANEARRLLDREGDDGVAALGVDLGVAARSDDDILLAVDHVGRRRRIDAGAGLELQSTLPVASS